VNVVLASGSPRRRELLASAGLTVEVRPSNVDETRDPAMGPAEHARALAVRKAAVVDDPAAVVVAADTVVHRDGALFEKPLDREEARAHLRALSGRWHVVTTGVCVRRGADQRVFSVDTEVRFRELGAPEIKRYLETGEADDKAGAYGIQGHGGALVAEIRGSYTNVVGLPLEETLRAVRQTVG
jgi:septum formation protein